MKELFKKYYEQIAYLFFGGCTTLVYLIAYYVITRAIGLDAMTATVLSWIISVTFAYVTNKLWVFESRTVTKHELLKEITSFYSCRLFTLGVDMLITFVFVSKLKYPDMIIKIIANIIVILLNYILSKLIIFRNKVKEESHNHNIDLG